MLGEPIEPMASPFQPTLGLSECPTMTIHKLTTNLNCGSCVAAVRPSLDADPAIRRWTVDTNDPGKVLTVEGEEVTPEQIARHVERAGFKVFGPVGTGETINPSGDRRSFMSTYWPVVLVFAYSLGVAIVFECFAEKFDGMRAMSNFMGGFFVAFSFFKLLDLRGFADAFQSYDVVAKPIRAYGYLYPFIELALGLAYLVRFSPLLTNAATLAFMLVGMVGVAGALARKRQIRCACLGTVFNLPMSTVALIEDGLMAAMSAIMLAVILS